jgi:predicted metal-binding membrane protein
MQPDSLEFILKKDRYILIAGLFIICLLSWSYIIYIYRQMYPMNMNALFFAMPMSPRWTPTDFSLIFLMWFVMMICMMTPSVSPLILIFSMVNRQKKQRQAPFVPAGYLLTGYFVMWALFSLVATMLQWFLQKINLLNPEMIVTNEVAGGIILIVAGLFQFTHVKIRCLSFCSTPIDFINRHWNEGKKGAFAMGMKNGLYCLGCCWVLMILLFVTGIMNVLWIALIAIFVLIEKLVPRIKWISYTAGAALIIYGVYILAKVY